MDKILRYLSTKISPAAVGYFIVFGAASVFIIVAYDFKYFLRIASIAITIVSIAYLVIDLYLLFKRNQNGPIIWEIAAAITFGLASYYLTESLAAVLKNIVVGIGVGMLGVYSIARY